MTGMYDCETESQRDMIPVFCSMHIQVSLIILRQITGLCVDSRGSRTGRGASLADCTDMSADKSGSTIQE